MSWNPPESRPKGVGVGQVVLIVAGVLAALVGFALMLGGGALVWAHTTQRDSAGFYSTTRTTYATSTYGLTSRIDLGRAPGEHDWTIAHPVGTVRVRATGSDERPLFVGIARQADVDRWLTGVPHAQIRGANFGPFHSRQTTIPGERAAAAPRAQSFWVASAVGPGAQTVLWRTEGGSWTIVVMNADASAGVRASVGVGAKTGILLPIGLGVGGAGLLFLAGAAAMLFFGLHHQTGPAGAVAGPDTPASPPGTYPVRLNAHLDAPLSRWLWLLKWLLLIPHVVALAFLWLTAVILSVAAGLAILITGRYPRSIFDFNVGVMRWTWRVSFYGLGAFGTDRYPPFSLRSDPRYPADFDVEYPERLSRGLVLVKWWLLALPHYLVIAFFAGGFGLGTSGSWRLTGGMGLIGLLALVAVIITTARGRYPESIFDFVMGMNRWCYRVLAYAALMRDEYPPFRLDTGGIDPGSIPFTSPPAPDRGGELVGSR